MSSDPVVAVIGTGSAGQHHLDALVPLPCALLAVPKRQARLAQLQHDQWTVAEDVVSAAQQGAELAIVASDTGCHVADALAAIEAGMDVLVEKPLAVDASEARRLRDEAARVGRKVYVGCVLRFSSSLAKFRELLPAIGALHAVRIECRSSLKDWRPERRYQDSYSARAAEGGALRDLIHEIDYAGWIFGWPSEVEGRLRNLRRLGIESEEMAEVRWGTGPSVSVELDYLTRPLVRQAVAYGEHGTVTWDWIAGCVGWFPADKPAQAFPMRNLLPDLFKEQAKAFLDSRHGEVDPRLATIDDGIKALAVCDAARESSLSGRPVRVDYT